MHIIIPMSGLGNRFVQAGYKDPKPLIMIDGKPIIEHVCDLFPGEEKITFICYEPHLQTTQMRQILQRIRPTAEIIALPEKPHGPVASVSKIFDRINDDEEVIVNYCDFGVYWDYQDFLQHTRSRNADGAIPAYRHFHPHMLGTTNYAFMRHDQQWMLEIQEKKPFTDNRMEEFASSGTYYFKHGRYVKKYFQQLMDLNLDLNGEFYVSMVYNLLKQDHLNISIYEIQHMLQWGTPADVEEYLDWSEYFKRLVEMPQNILPKQAQQVNLIPMAGFGKRFSDAGYQKPKPLIEVSGKPMVIQAAQALPPAAETIFVCLDEHLKKYPIAATIQQYESTAKIFNIPKVTEGQAITCGLGLVGVDLEKSLMIAACDNSMLFDSKKWVELLNDPQVDAFVFTFKHHPSVKQHPKMYGYVKVDEHDVISGVSVKVPLSDRPEEDHAIVGAFFFKKVRMFQEGLKALQEKNVRVNNEFYVDSLIGELVALGYRLKPLVVDHYICWGTPNDFRTFEYWQSFFHKVAWHPYSLKKDPSVAKEKRAELDQAFHQFSQEYR